MQQYSHSVELTFMQQLQMRIAKERGINVDTLNGEEYKVLQDYKKFETRRIMLNDFQGLNRFDSDQDMHPGDTQRNGPSEYFPNSVENNLLMSIDAWQIEKE